MIGRVHSVESFGTVDGPGIRMVIFLSGCPMRCLYCHNPDTWDPKGGTPMTVEEILAQFEQARPFYKKGGITVSGGEPLMQIRFVTELFEAARARNIHTCLDTAGAGKGDYKAILANTDLVLFDVKHEDPDDYHALTGGDIRRPQAFVEAVRKAGVPMWVRHVVVPGLTDGETHLAALRAYVETLPRVERVELLPYHTLGVEKYAALGRPYSLEGVPDMDKARCAALEEKWFQPWNRRV